MESTADDPSTALASSTQTGRPSRTRKPSTAVREALASEAQEKERLEARKKYDREREAKRKKDGDSNSNAIGNRTFTHNGKTYVFQSYSPPPGVSRYINLRLKSKSTSLFT